MQVELLDGDYTRTFKGEGCYNATSIEPCRGLGGRSLICMSISVCDASTKECVFSEIKHKDKIKKPVSV
jgi:hypothetical protein